MTKLPFIWEEYHYLHYEKSTDWKWSVGIIAVTVALVSFMFGNITFGVLFLIAVSILLIHAFREPGMLRFEINQTGVRIEQEKWSYTEFKSFWIEDNREHHMPSRILFQSNALLSPILTLPLPIATDQADLHDLHEELVKILPEQKLTESLLHKMMEYLGF